MLEKKNIPVEWIPHSYQLEAIRWCIEGFQRENCSALFLQPGLGKTSITLEVFKRLKKQGKVKTMLIVAPLRVAQQTWPSEIKKWLNFIDLSHIVLHGPNKDELLLKKADIYIINYEGLKWLTSKKWAGCDMLVFDELTRMKSWSAERVKAIKPFLPTFNYRLGLTGTPVPNGLYDLFSQVYMLDLGQRFGRRITQFKNQFFKENIYNYKLETFGDAENIIYKKLENLAFRVEGKNYIDLPEEIHNLIELELPQNLKEKYKTLKRELIVELENLEVVTAVSAAALSTKLRQFLSGNIYIKKDNVVAVEYVHNLKLEALKEFVENLNGEPLLVGYMFKHELSMFKKTFKQAEFIEGNMNSLELNSIITRWNRGEIPLLFGHPQSVGHGLNLQGSCNNVMFYSLTFNLETYLQFYKRVARQGQKERHVYIHYLTFKNTIDEYLFEVLTKKDNSQTNLLKFLTQEI